jgi:hypothetical protein
MLDWKMILNIVVGIVLAAIVIALGGSLFGGAGWGGKERGMYGKEKAMMQDGAPADDAAGAAVEVNVQ